MPKGDGITSAGLGCSAGTGTHMEKGPLTRSGPGKDDLGSSNGTSYSLRAKPWSFLMAQSLQTSAFGSFLPGCHKQKTLHTADTSQAETIRHFPLFLKNPTFILRDIEAHLSV